ncbi:MULTISPECIES: hypothetical protein [Streptomyces]|uniref:Uncharacterized protein n=1 Tax=Streptomyces gilvifuscus TaxID=1550617 RepID=A0ABT5FPP5_9ACTN|nr:MULTISPECIES: hypothetical protein [Streptomyces]MBK3643583.1 hypothetical protein [Streptomyces sp. MBT33]MDC2954463.1 hypothetical protein [Streptomyces gilvifuscus]
MSGNHENAERPPRTALEEVLREAEDAEVSGEKRDDEGEAGDAVTPSRHAQEESEGE